MPWPVHDSWNQHLDELNSRDYSRPLKVSLVRIEGPFENSATHIRHVHPYWQMSVVLEKSFSVDFDHFSLFPEAGDIMVIPPQNWHYVHLENGKKAWTIKFVLEESEEQFEPGIIEKNDETVLLAKWLREIMVHDHEGSVTRFVLMEHLISALLDQHFSNRNLDGSDIDLVKKVRHFIQCRLEQCMPVRVEDVAKELQFTTTYLTRIFKKQLGIPLKVYIDQQRFDMGRKLLTYSDLNISQIADELGYPDAFSFSRFFKRMSGSSPSSYRKRND